MRALRRWWVWALAGLALQLAPWPATWADAVYLGVTLPLWSQVSSRLVGAVPLSVGAGLALFAVAALVASLAWPSGHRRAGRVAGWSVAALLMTLPFTFGLGYHTTPLLAWDGRAGDVLAEDGPAPAEGYAMARKVVLARLTASAGTGRPVVHAGFPDTASLAECVATVVAELRERPAPRLPDRVKALPAGSLLRFGFAGVVFPWLLEPHVDSGLPPSASTAVALHELSHSAGYAREAEAEAVAMLAGLDCDDPSVRYAASLRAAASLAARLPSASRSEFLALWPPGALADVRAAAAASASFRSAALSAAAERAYDVYLVSQGTEAGIADYDRATDLLVRLLVAGLADEPARRGD